MVARYSQTIDAAAMAARYRDGESIKKLADSIGIGYSQMHTLLAKQGVEFRRKGTQPYIPVGPIPGLVGRYKDGETIDELAHALGLNAGVVRNRLLSAGVTLRRRGPRFKPAK